ncbi:MAG: hypothetical protein A3J38_10160 [Gammaproteobacteria bacterium RIFCSPHIGHO2_12_FULL_45_9]|nr:MAG: hypothetical protein A3J38_10160 [Gammaproteobacteria bacterium RIFCSPHIGHO2_12_FULL_45_9]
MLKELLLNRGSESKQTSTSSSAVESETPTPPEVYDTIQSIDVETPEYVGRQIAAMGPTVIQPGISHTLHEMLMPAGAERRPGSRMLRVGSNSIIQSEQLPRPPVSPVVLPQSPLPDPQQCPFVFLKSRWFFYLCGMGVLGATMVAQQADEDQVIWPPALWSVLCASQVIELYLADNRALQSQRITAIILASLTALMTFTEMWKAIPLVGASIFGGFSFWANKILYENSLQSLATYLANTWDQVHIPQKRIELGSMLLPSFCLALALTAKTFHNSQETLSYVGGVAGYYVTHTPSLYEPIALYTATGLVILPHLAFTLRGFEPAWLKWKRHVWFSMADWCALSAGKNNTLFLFCAAVLGYGQWPFMQKCVAAFLSVLSEEAPAWVPLLLVTVFTGMRSLQFARALLERVPRAWALYGDSLKHVFSNGWKPALSAGWMVLCLLGNAGAQGFMSYDAENPYTLCSVALAATASFLVNCYPMLELEFPAVEAPLPDTPDRMRESVVDGVRSVMLFHPIVRASEAQLVGNRNTPEQQRVRYSSPAAFSREVASSDGSDSVGYHPPSPLLPTFTAYRV